MTTTPIRPEVAGNWRSRRVETLTTQPFGKAAAGLASITAGVSLLLPIFNSVVLREVIRYRVLVILLYAPAVLFGLPHIRSSLPCFPRKLPLLAFVTLAFASVIWTDATEMRYTFVSALYLAMAVPIGALIVETRTLYRSIAYFKWATATCLVILAVYSLRDGGLVNFRLGQIVVNPSDVLDYANPNMLGAQLGFAALLLLGVLLTRQKSRGLFLVMTGLFLCGVLATASRSVALATAAGILLIIVPSIKRQPHLLIRTLWVLFFTTTLMVGVTDIIPTGSLGEIVSRWTDSDVETLGERVPIWLRVPDALNATADPTSAWLYGVGLGGVDKALGEGVSIRTKGITMFEDGIPRAHSHNQYLELLIGLGLLGLPLEVYLLVSLMRGAFRLDRAEKCFNRSSILLFWGMFMLTGVAFKELYWPGIGGIVLAVLSSSKGRSFSPAIWNRKTAEMTGTYDRRSSIRVSPVSLHGTGL